MTYRVDTNSDITPSRQLVEGVLDRLARGEIPAGERLPSVRGMAADALVNPNTVVKAYRELESLGAIQGRNGSGYFITPQGPEIARKQRGGETLADFRRAAARALAAGHGPGRLLAELGPLLEGQRETIQAGKGKKA